MMHESRLLAKGCLAVGLVAGLTACGGGSSAPGPTVAPSGSPAPEMTITPPANRAPEAVGSVPAQVLTVGGTAAGVDVAAYFSDPDGDMLTYSARSGDPEILGVRVSGSTVTFTPVSEGTATVTVIAGDGEVEAEQGIAVKVRRRRSAPTTVPSPPPPPSPSPPESSPPPAQEPQTRLAGIVVERQGSTFITVKAVPQDATLSGVGMSWSPFEAGSPAQASDSGNERWFRFYCSQSPRYTGAVDVVVRVRNPDGGNFTGSTTLSC